MPSTPPAGNAVSVDPTFVRATIVRLRDERVRRGGRLPAGAIEAAALSCAVAPSTMLRYLAQGPPGERRAQSAWRWGDDARAAYYRAAGNVTLARALLAAQDDQLELPSVATMYRAAQRDFTPDERMLAKRGQRAARAKRLVCAVEETHRNERWYADHKLLDASAVEPRASRAKRPWITVVVDGYSRRVVGASLAITPNRGHVLAALGQAIRACGIPAELVFDRGKEFLSEAVAEHAAALGYLARATAPYSPHHKGKVERLHLTLNQRLAEAVGTVPSPARTTRGKPLIAVPEGLPLGELAAAFFEVVSAYNGAPHRSLGGRSPLSVYSADATPEHQVDQALLRRFLLAAGTRKITEHGLRFEGRAYWAEELEGRRGETVEIRWAQDDRRSLEVYRGGTYWCTAVLVDPASPEQHERILEIRRRHMERQQADLRRARRLARAQWRAITAGSGVEDSTPVTAGDAMALDDVHSDAHIRLLAEVGLTLDVDA